MLSLTRKTSGQFAPEFSGQFAPETSDQFGAEKSAQVTRNFQSYDAILIIKTPFQGRQKIILLKYVIFAALLRIIMKDISQN